MITEMECTDCEHCAIFDGGFRLYCMHPELSANKVCTYHPIGDTDAKDCRGFEEGDSLYFSEKDIDEYEKYSVEKYGDVNYQGVREWIEQNKAKGE